MEFYLFKYKTERSDSLTLDHFTLCMIFKAKPFVSDLAQRIRVKINMTK